jgi:AbrB family transcriptional regulator, transcriptional pleiotropic regulator of transition state genes
MRAPGIIRRLDPLGRIVLPKTFRDILAINIKDEIEISVDGTSIIVAKHEARCLFCGENENIVYYKKKPLCKACYEDIVDMKKF